MLRLLLLAAVFPGGLTQRGNAGLQTLRAAWRKKWRLVVSILDMRKAFDSVSHTQQIHLYDSDVCSVVDMIEKDLKKFSKTSFMRSISIATSFKTAKMVAGWAAVEIIKKYGYPVETHYVDSEDGYITTLNRIPHNGTNVGEQRPVVFLQHGLSCSDNIYVILGPEKSLGFLLADRGYDVWMGNARGSRYSLNHVNYTTKDKQYWDFSFHEMGYFDLPKHVDYILGLTGLKAITYVGHSMGNAIAMVLLTTRPEYNEKINFIFALAPAVFFGPGVSIVFRTLQMANAEAVALNGNQQAFPPDLAVTYPGYWKVCEPFLPTTAICRAFYVSSSGLTSSVAQSSFPAIYSIIPTSTSARVMAHYNQIGQKDAFRMYDYGPVKNTMLYGSTEPPDYDLSRVSVPVLVVYSDADIAVPAVGAMKFNRFLPNSTIYRVPESKYNHFDFVFGETSINHVYPTIFRILQGIY